MGQQHQPQASAACMLHEAAAALEEHLLPQLSLPTMMALSRSCRAWRDLIAACPVAQLPPGTRSQLLPPGLSTREVHRRRAAGARHSLGQAQRQVGRDAIPAPFGVLGRISLAACLVPSEASGHSRAAGCESWNCSADSRAGSPCSDLPWG